MLDKTFSSTTGKDRIRAIREIAFSSPLSLRRRRRRLLLLLLRPRPQHRRRHPPPPHRTFQIRFNNKASTKIQRDLLTSDSFSEAAAQLAKPHPMTMLLECARTGGTREQHCREFHSIGWA